MTEKKKILEQVPSTVFQEGVDFFIDVNNPGILHRLGLKRKSRYFTIKPIFLGTLTAISGEILQMGILDKKNLEENPFDFSLEQVVKHREKLINIIALAIHNKPGNPPKELMKFLEHNLTVNEMLQVLNIVIRQMDVSNFIKSIISLRGMSLLNPEETIASGDLSGESKNTSDSV